MLDRASWLDRAQALKVGEKRRTTHDCGPGSVLTIEHKPTGWSAWCYRCNDKGWAEKEGPSLEDMRAARALRARRERAVQGELQPPGPMEFDPGAWPAAARCWVYKAGLSSFDIDAMGLYWNPELERVIIPCIIMDSVLYWQARAVDGRQPKYLNPGSPGPEVVPIFGDDGPLVLVEDMLSAYRVGQVARGLCMLGTNLKDSVMRQCLKEDRVIVWLDPDWDKPGRPGQKFARQIVRQLQLAGVDAVNIVSRCDPKLLSEEEIREVITNAGRDPASADEAPGEVQPAGPSG